MPLTAQAALDRLVEGNRRFASNVRSVESLLSQLHRAQLVDVQAPFAVVVACSDARGPAEIVFDQGLGDLFVIRVAGNVVAPSQIGSVEFAAERFGTRLVVVMGHTDCGAIEATIDAIAGTDHGGKHVASIVDRIRPAVEGVVRSGVSDRAELRRAAERANVRASVAKLAEGSPLITELIANGLRIVGGEYDLETGVVEFFEGVPLAPS
jgi:carbonic anhydrase